MTRLLASLALAVLLSAIVGVWYQWKYVGWLLEPPWFEFDSLPINQVLSYDQFVVDREVTGFYSRPTKAKGFQIYRRSELELLQSLIDGWGDVCLKVATRRDWESISALPYLDEVKLNALIREIGPEGTSADQARGYRLALSNGSLLRYRDYNGHIRGHLYLASDAVNAMLPFLRSGVLCCQLEWIGEKVAIGERRLHYRDTPRGHEVRWHSVALLVFMPSLWLSALVVGRLSQSNFPEYSEQWCFLVWDFLRGAAWGTACILVFALVFVQLVGPPPTLVERVRLRELVCFGWAPVGAGVCAVISKRLGRRSALALAVTALLIPTGLTYTPVWPQVDVVHVAGTGILVQVLAIGMATRFLYQGPSHLRRVALVLVLHPLWATVGAAIPALLGYGSGHGLFWKGQHSAFISEGMTAYMFLLGALVSLSAAPPIRRDPDREP